MVSNHSSLHRTDGLTRATPALRTAAERLLALDAAGKNAAAKLPAIARVSERFRLALSSLLGAAGFRALLARAVTLAKAEAPELKAVQVQADGSMEGLDLLGRHDGKRRFSDGEVVLVAHILGLLVTFVGEALMLRVVNDAWPKAMLDDLDFAKGGPRD
jgi:hypothetical protein